MARQIGPPFLDGPDQLVLIYEGAQRNTVEVAVSRDGGQTFTNTLPAASGLFVGFPALAIGADVSPGQAKAVIAFTRFDPTILNFKVGVTRAAIDRTSGQLGPWSASEDVPGSEGADFAAVDIGPNGEEFTVWAAPSPGGGSSILGSLKQGTGGYATPNLIAHTIIDVSMAFTLPGFPQGTHPGQGVAWYGAGNVIYVAFMDVDAAAGDPTLTNIYAKSSSDFGTTWSDAVQVNQGGGSTWLPSITAHQVTGGVAIAYYSTQNDPNNVSAQYYGARSSDGGVTWQNVQISQHSSDATQMSTPGGYGIRGDLGPASRVLVETALSSAWAAANTPGAADILGQDW
jgi:hypothetical protein